MKRLSKIAFAIMVLAGFTVGAENKSTYIGGMRIPHSLILEEIRETMAVPVSLQSILSIENIRPVTWGGEFDWGHLNLGLTVFGNKYRYIYKCTLTVDSFDGRTVTSFSHLDCSLQALLPSRL